VSKKLKHREFHFNLGVLFRWIFFALIVYFSINYLSNNNSKINISSNTHSTKLNILGVNTEPVIMKATETYEQYKKQVIKFVNDQIVDIKKQVVTKMYDEVIKNIDNSKK